MEKVKDFFIRIFKEIRREYTRVDRTCNACGREIFGGESVGEKLFCTDCYEHLPFNNGHICARCGRSSVEPVEVCESCEGEELPFYMARSPFYYAPPIDRIIRSLKYDNRKYLAEVLAPFMAQTYFKFFAGADAITFVPSSERAKRKRGYNQARLIAEQVSLLTGTPVVDVLVKSAETDRQVRLNRKERRLNLKDVIKVGNKALIAEKRVVLIDDVMTTGATAEAASSVLRRAGATRVYVLTAASVTDARTAHALGQERSSGAVRREKERKRLVKKLERQRKRAERSKRG